MTCVFQNDIDCLKAAVKEGADINEKNEPYGTTPLMIACNWEGHEDMIEALLSLGADPNLRDKQGNTALFAAASVSAKAVKLLLDKGADPLAANELGTTAFTSCVTGILMESVDTTLAGFFLDLGADVNEAAGSGRTSGYTCLMMAANNGAHDLAKFLLAHGADPNMKAGDGNTALSLARKEGDEAMVKILEEAGAK